MIPKLTGCCLLLTVAVLPAAFAQSASVSDCLGAIPICRPVYEETRSPVGAGKENEIHPADNCIREERNSVWYTFTVGESGDFGFELTPNDPGDDYDWVLFDITQADCDDLYGDPSLIVSCNAAGGPGCFGPTGANGDTDFAVQGFNCGNLPPTVDAGFSSFNALIPVEAGNTYALCISNWSGSPNGYRLDFSLSGAIGIFDESPPALQAVTPPATCEERVFLVQLSEPVLCATIHDSNFRLTVGGRSIPLRLESTNCAAGGNFTRSLRLLASEAVPGGRDYQLVMRPNNVYEILDLCGNGARADTLQGRITGYGLPLGPDTTLCEGRQLVIDLSGEGYSDFRWQDGSPDSVYTIAAPGTYSVELMGACGPERDTLHVRYESSPPVLTLVADTTICPGGELRLRLPDDGAVYRWQDGQRSADYRIVAPGAYAVTATNGCGSTTAEIDVRPVPPLQWRLPADTFFCPGASLRLTADMPDATFYQWTGRPPGPEITIDEPGAYAVTAGNACETLSAVVEVRACEQCTVFLPNAFSPNGDGVNDVFQPYSDCDLSAYSLRIFDRWGSFLAEFTDPGTGWDGSARSRPLGQGVYVWVVRYAVVEEGRPREVEEAGEVLLVR